MTPGHVDLSHDHLQSMTDSQVLSYSIFLHLFAMLAQKRVAFYQHLVQNRFVKRQFWAVLLDDLPCEKSNAHCVPTLGMN